MSELKKLAKGAMGTIKNIRTRSSTRASSRAGSDMSVDPPTPPAPASSSSLAPKILLKLNQLGLRDSRERDVYKKIKDKEFTHTPAFNLALLQEAGMSTEFYTIFSLLGWASAWDVAKIGSKLLTIECLCTLRTTESGVYFRFFKQEFYLTWRELSYLLNFSSNILVDIDEALGDFEKHKFWTEISKHTVFYSHRTSDIEHPTLRFFHKWLGFTFFSRDDTSKVRVADLQLMYAAIKKIKVSPIHLLVAHWLVVPSYRIGPVAICLLVNRIAAKLNMLQGASINFIEDHRDTFGYEHFYHAHLLKRINMTYGETKLRLPNPELALYSVQTFQVELQAQPVNTRVP
jgi:hypothetical protein